MSIVQTDPQSHPTSLKVQEGEMEVSKALRACAGGMGELSDEPCRLTKSNDSPDNSAEGAKVGEVVMGVLQALRSIQNSLGNGDDEERRPGVLDEPSDEPSVKPRGPSGVQVDPWGETEAKQNKSATVECADAAVEGEVAGICQDARVEMESAMTHWEASIEGEELNATTYARSMTTDEENGQCNETNVEDIPGTPPEPPPPLTSPDKPTRPKNEIPKHRAQGGEVT